MKYFAPKLEEQLKETSKTLIPAYSHVPVSILQEGENIIRILPPWNESGKIFKVLAIHWFGSSNARIGLLCNRIFHKACYICETLNSLLGKGIFTSDQIKPYWAQRRAFANVLNLQKLEEGVIIMSLPFKKVMMELIQFFQDENYGDFTHPEHGYAFKIKKVVSGMFPTYSVVPIPKKEPIPLPLESIELYNLDDFKNVWKVTSYEEQKAMWEIYSDLIETTSENGEVEIAKEDIPIVSNISQLASSDDLDF